MSELKACPFCNNSTEFLIERIDLCSSVVICQGMIDEHCACLARGPIGGQDDDGEEQPGKAAAIREWNSRAIPEGYALVPVEPRNFYDVPENCRQRLVVSGKPYPRSSCAVCGKFSPKYEECNATLAAAQEVE